ncbi:MAG: glycosyltransferase family 39 protein, partial [Thermoanaerobaculia bacterium]
MLPLSIPTKSGGMAAALQICVIFPRRMSEWREKATRTELALLSLITLAGAYLRFDRLALPSLWLDEILSYDVATTAARQPWWHWLVASFEPEHGPLFHALLLFGRIAQTPEFSVRVIAAICGTIAIPVVWSAARNCSGPTAGIAAAALLAVSPLSVYYSRDGRPYAMLMLLSAAILAEALGPARFLVIAMLALTCAYTSATAAPLLIAFALCSAAVAMTTAAAERRVWIRNALAAVGGICVMALLYRSHTPDVSVTVAPRLDARAIVQSLSVTALQPSASRIAFLVLALAILGA